MNEHVDDAASADADVAPNRKRRWLRPVLLILGPTVVIIGGAY
jgi:membrane fusion protein (multidrug efflux system)